MVEDKTLLFGHANPALVFAPAWGALLVATAATPSGHAVDGAGIADSFKDHAGIAMDWGGARLLVADTFNHRIRAVTLSGTVTTLAGTGANAWVDGPALATASFSLPRSVVGAPSGALNVAESGRVRVVGGAAGAGGVGTLAGSAAVGWGDSPVGATAMFAASSCG